MQWYDYILCAISFPIGFWTIGGISVLINSIFFVCPFSNVLCEFGVYNQIVNQQLKKVDLLGNLCSVGTWIVFCVILIVFGSIPHILVCLAIGVLIGIRPSIKHMGYSLSFFHRFYKQHEICIDSERFFLCLETKFKNFLYID